MDRVDGSESTLAAKRRALCMALGLSPIWARAANAAAWSWSDAKQSVLKAARPSTQWDGPKTGPSAQSHKNIALCASNLRNGGVLGVALGIREATRVMGWNMRVFHSSGSDATEHDMIAAAIASGSDGLVVVGSDHHALDLQLKPYAALGRPIIGWHAGSEPGPIADSAIFLNVTTDPLEVARVTALAAMLPTHGQAGVVIFTDKRYEIARVKADKMADVVRECGGTVLDLLDVPLSSSPQHMAQTVQTLVAQYGARWTHALAINDIYFDYAVPELMSLGLSEDRPKMLSAGDGSASALLRILAGSFQTSTVAEPLNLQGWQIVDELNRRFAGQAPSGYVAPVHLVTQANLDADGGTRLMYDPGNGYRLAYSRIWERN